MAQPTATSTPSCSPHWAASYLAHRTAEVGKKAQSRSPGHQETEMTSSTCERTFFRSPAPLPQGSFLVAKRGKSPELLFHPALL